MAKHVECGCGAACGEKCTWSGPRSETVIVEWMPEHLRGSHVSANNRGTYPANGAIRFRAEKSCARSLVREDCDWARVVA